MSSQGQKRRVRAVIIASLLVITSIVVARWLDETDDAMAFVVTGNFDKPGDFCHDVWEGANAAAALLEHSSQLAPVVLKLNTKGSASEKVFRTELLKLCTSRNIQAIISADISTIAPSVIRVANRYRLPVLLTVATNDQILAERRDDLSFRLVPTDTKQARLLASWCRDKRRVAIIHGAQTPYGQFLGGKTVEFVNQERIEFPDHREPPIITPYSDNTDLFPVISQFNAIEVDGIVFIGYTDRFLELAGKLKSLKWSGPVLMSDGCYSPQLIRAPLLDNLSLSFATRPQPIAGRENIRANGVFGHDAYILLADALSELRKRAGVERTISAALRRVTGGRNQRIKLIEYYEFDTVGENRLAEFQHYRLTSDQIKAEREQ